MQSLNNWNRSNPLLLKRNSRLFQ